MQKFQNTQLDEVGITEEIKNHIGSNAAKYAHMIHGTDISIEESQGPMQSCQGSSNDQVLLPGRDKKRDPTLGCTYGDYIGDDALLVGGGEINLDESPEVSQQEESK